MPIEVRDNIYSDIANQFPNVYKENSEFLLAFVEAYYEHLDEKLDRDIPKLKDIDTTLNTFLIFYKRKYLSEFCLLYTSPSPRDRQKSRMPSSA